MNPFLPDYEPPAARRATLAAGAAPLVVLVAFTLIVLRWLDPVAGVAWCGACTVWVVHEMSVFQRLLDAYNQGYARRHLEWRSNEALSALALAPGVTAATREFVQRFVQADRRVLRDGQVARLS